MGLHLRRIATWETSSRQQKDGANTRRQSCRSRKASITTASTTSCSHCKSCGPAQDGSNASRSISSFRRRFRDRIANGEQLQSLVFTYLLHARSDTHQVALDVRCTSSSTAIVSFTLAPSTNDASPHRQKILRIGDSLYHSILFQAILSSTGPTWYCRIPSRRLASRHGRFDGGIARRGNLRRTGSASGREWKEGERGRMACSKSQGTRRSRSAHL